MVDYYYEFNEHDTLPEFPAYQLTIEEELDIASGNSPTLPSMFAANDNITPFVLAIYQKEENDNCRVFLEYVRGVSERDNRVSELKSKGYEVDWSVDSDAA